MSFPSSSINALSETLGLKPNVVGVLVGLLLIMTIGTTVRFIAVRRSTPEVRNSRLASLKSWWAIVVLVVAGVALGRAGGVALVGLASLLAIREYFALIPGPGSPWHLRYLAYAAVVINYVLVYLGWYAAFVVFVPLVVFLVLPVRMILTGYTHGFLQDVSRLFWGLMLAVFCLSHWALLLTLPDESNPVGGAAGWFVYLVLLTEGSDIAQALWGRRFGSHSLAASVSPKKSWEGFAGGLITTVLAAVLLAPVLTPWADGVMLSVGDRSYAVPYLWSVVAGVLICVGGLFGDLTMSELKRDLGKKDCGTMVPGQGGILDRIDSMTFTAPLFFYFVYMLR